MRKVTAAIINAVTFALIGASAAMLHAQANEGQSRPVWVQDVVTINDEATASAAQGWDAPMELVYAEHGADIQVTRPLPGGRVAGEAERIMDGDTIVGCRVQVQTETETRAVLAHEVGHCLGLTGHAMTPTSLMHAVTGQPGVSAHDVTDADRHALALLYTTR